MTPPRMAFIDLAAQRARMGDKIDAAIRRVLDHGAFIMGPEVEELEIQLARFCGARHAISCANGTDAITLVLMAKGVKPGDAVVCPSFTFAATAEAVACLGATPIFVDVLDTTFNMDPSSLDQAIFRSRELRLNLVGVIAVDLFGQPADYDEIEPICRREALWLLCDAAQSFGANYRGRAVGSIGSATTTSFFPAKPLGCYGDGGAIFTDDENLAMVLRSLRVHGQGREKYDNVRIGMNARLDTLQAAVLVEKLGIFSEEIAYREEVASRYSESLSDIVVTPTILAGVSSVWAQYTIVVANDQRRRITSRLNDVGVPTAQYYPLPVHLQTAYRQFPRSGDCLPESEQLSQCVISLPMHPYLTRADQDHVVTSLRAVVEDLRAAQSPFGRSRVCKTL